jgi:tripartite ATP-independent transporter DctM subunit
MTALFGILLLVMLLGLGVPVAWSFAAVVAYLTFIFDVNLSTLMLQGFRSLNSVILLALPLFVLAGYLMQSGGIARRLIDFIEIALGGRKGGLGASLVLSSGVFGAISGTATAAVASVGTVLIDPLEKRGYPRGYTSALLGIASLLGILIPPSVTMILFAVVSQQSVAAAFAATIGPGLLLMAGLILFNRLCVGRLFHELPPETGQDQGAAPARPRSRVVLAALPALSLPVIILGGIYGGVFTPTEAAAVAVLASLVIGALIYRELTWKKLGRGIVAASETTGSIILILLFSFMIGKILVFERAPQDLAAFISHLLRDPLAILLVVNLFLILAGALMDDVSVTVVIAPLFLPLMVDIGVHPIHFASIVACSVVIGANSPPVAPILYMACRIGRTSVHKAIRPSLMMMGFVALPVMLLTSLFPDISLFLPRLFGLI